MRSVVRRCSIAVAARIASCVERVAHESLCGLIRYSALMLLRFGHARQFGAACTFCRTFLVLRHQQYLSTRQRSSGVACGLLRSSDMTHRVQYAVQPVFHGRRGRGRGMGEHGMTSAAAWSFPHPSTMR